MMLQDELLAKALQEIEGQVSKDGGVVTKFVAIAETEFVDQPGAFGYRVFASGSPAHTDGLALRLQRILVRQQDERTEGMDS